MSSGVREICHTLLKAEKAVTIFVLSLMAQGLPQLLEYRVFNVNGRTFVVHGLLTHGAQSFVYEGCVFLLDTTHSNS